MLLFDMLDFAMLHFDLLRSDYGRCSRWPH